MHITPYKTPKLSDQQSLQKLIDAYIPLLHEREIIVVTSKIVSICYGDVVLDDGTIEKKDLIRQEADYYLGDQYPTPYGHTITIKNSVLIPSAGIDESNGAGNFILWPRHLQQRTNQLWEHICKQHALSHAGVIVTDSKTTPLRWGTSGIGLSWCGFEAFKDYRGTPDIFGRQLRTTKANILDGLAAAAVLAMGEGNEQTPLAVISDLPFITFQERTPTQEELANLSIDLADDIYAPLLTSVTWNKKVE
jgi:putative folate metabolism gamma-glutamate ligase